MLRRLLATIRISLHSLGDHKVRNALAVTGVAFGTLSLVVVGNVTAMLAAKLQKEADAFGKNLLIVTVRSGRTAGRDAAFSMPRTLKVADGEVIRDRLPYVTEISPSYDTSFPLRYNFGLTTGTVIGVTENYPQLRTVPVAKGRFFLAEEMAGVEKKAIIGSKIADLLFAGEDPVGKTILLARAPFEVVGVLGQMGVDLSGADQDVQVLVPFETMMRRLVNVDYLKTLYVQVADDSFLKQGKEDVAAILRRQHGLAKGARDDFRVQAITDLATIKEDATTLVRELGTTAAILSFSIGGLGILAIMMITVAERKKEIGIRRAVGATRRDILLQFLMEAVLLTAIGTAAGLVASFVITAIVSRVGELPFAVAHLNIGAAIVLGFVLGLFSGIYPARRAAALEPVGALQGL